MGGSFKGFAIFLLSRGRGKQQKFHTDAFFFFLFSITGDYTLDINPVLLEDDAEYQCQVSQQRSNCAVHGGKFKMN